MSDKPFKPDDYDVLLFDCYGTLVDWETAITTFIQPLLLSKDVHLYDESVLDFYSEWEPEEQEAGGSYQDVLGRVLKRFGQRLAFTPTQEECANFVMSIARSNPFPDTKPALETLASHFELGIISNTDPDLLAKTIAPLDTEFQYLITAGEVGAYKPELMIFEHSKEVVGTDKRVLHVAQSLFHDIAPANTIGHDNVWIHRSEDKKVSSAVRPSDAQPTWTYATLGAFADSIES